MKFYLYASLILALSLSGCASVMGKKSQLGDSLGDAGANSSYHEAVSGETVQRYSAASCPSSEWQGADWRKIVGYANACVKAGDWSKVEKLGNHLAIEAHTTPWGVYFLSLSASARKDYPRAVWMLELGLKKAPREGILHYQLGRVHWEAGQEALAVRELALASELNPSLVEAHTFAATLALQRQELAVAENLYERALRAEKGHWPAVMGLASVKIRSGNWKEAEDLLDQSVRLNPRSAKARLALAQVREEHLKKLSEALQSYKELKTLATENKLDEGLKFNLDEKIQTLEKSLSQAQRVNQVTVREPAAKKKVSK